MAKYYYLVASLPSLDFGEKPSIRGEAFLRECEKWLSPEDMKIIREADKKSVEQQESSNDVLREWKEFDLLLRKELANLREAKKRGEEPRGTDLTKTIIAEENPFLMERKFERIRWEYIEQKIPAYFFDINQLVLYFQKVRINERLAVFEKDKGENYFYKLCEVNYEEALG